MTEEAEAPKHEPIYKTIRKFNERFKGLVKDSENEYLGNKYMTLDDLMRAIQPHLDEAGLYISQVVDGSTLVTTICNESGETIESRQDLILERQTPQGMGSAITYARRYSICTMLQLVEAGSDDDGAGAEEKMISETQIGAITSACNVLGWGIEELRAELKKSKLKLDIQDIDELTEDQGVKVLLGLNRRIDERGE
jgi:hypothetical protein